MTNRRLCGLALLHVHYSRQVNIDKVIRQFLLMEPRNIIAPISARSAIACAEESLSDSMDESDGWSDAGSS